MNVPHLHLLLTHFPVIGTLVGGGLLLWGIIKKQDSLRTAAAAVLVIMAIIAIPAYLTGEGAEEAVEKLPGVGDAIIEQHEHAAALAIWIMGITGLAALVTLVMAWRKRMTANLFFTITLVLSIASFAAMGRTAYFGGQIRHSEIREGTAASTAEEEKADDKKDQEKDDD